MDKNLPFMKSLPVGAWVRIREALEAATIKAALDGRRDDKHEYEIALSLIPKFED